MPHCPVAGADCPDMDNCTLCLNWVASCDRCHVGGHTDSAGWWGYLVAPGTVRTLCRPCYEIEGGVAKEDAQAAIFGDADCEALAPDAN